MTEHGHLSRFNLPSAKNFSISRTVDMFVPTDRYWQMLDSDDPQVVFGTRGSGKTMLLRMMDAQHLQRLAETNGKAHDALYNRHRFGIFLPLGIDWCVAYQDQMDVPGYLFREGLNLVSIESFLDTLEVVVSVVAKANIPEEKIESELSEELGSLLFRSLPRSPRSFQALRSLVLRHQSMLKDSFSRYRKEPDNTPHADDYRFLSSSLFKPLSDAITVVNKTLQLDKEHRWLLCLDELEDLQDKQTAEVLTVLRGRRSPLVLKITTQPYTMEDARTGFGEAATTADFREYAADRLQYDPGSTEYEELISAILRKYINVHSDIAPDKLGEAIFGKTTFSELATDLPGVRGEEYKRTKERVLRASKNPDSARKVIPVLAIRALKSATEGNTKSMAYSGWSTIARVSDGNPGIFVRLLTELRVHRDTVRIDPFVQHETIRSLADTWHNWSIALYPDGKILYDFIARLGKQLSDRLHRHDRKDSELEEEVNRPYVDLTDISPDLSKALKVGARHALLVADSTTSSLPYPMAGGTWRLAYSLSPKFWLLPRRGRVSRFTSRQLDLFVGAARTVLTLDEDGEEVPDANQVEENI